MSTKAYKWNAVPSTSVAAGFDAAIRMNDVQGVLCGRTQSLPINSGQVLKKGTLLVNFGRTLKAMPSAAEYADVTFDAVTVTGTTGEKVVWTVAGLVITSTTNVLYISDLCLLLGGAQNGATGASLLAAYTAAGGTGIFSVSGTLTDYNVIADEARRTLRFLAAEHQASTTNFNSRTFELEDTASSPVDLLSHVSVDSYTPGDNVPVVGILAMDVDASSAVTSAAVFTEAELYDSYLNLAQEPASDSVGTKACTIYTSGLYNTQQLNLTLAGSKFVAIPTGTATV